MVQRAKLIPELEMVDNMEKFELQDLEAKA